jgi:Bifunctional DNA primase/polymerase, N-terminal
MTWLFAEHAPRLAGAGYAAIPISRHDDRRKVRRNGQLVPLYSDPGKQPAQTKGWQNGCPREDWAQYGDCGVGILTLTTPALDIDVLDAELAETIQGIADRVLGDAPYRIGHAPKRLLPFRLVGEPFRKLKVSWRGIGDQHHPATKPPAVELLTAGQQFVALGTHPGTGRPYEWYRDPDLSLPHGLLPGLDQAKAERFMRALHGMLTRCGATEVKLTGVRVEQESRPSRRLVAATEVAGRVRAGLERIGNPDLHYDDWIRLGHAIKAELPGPDGRALWSGGAHSPARTIPP